MSRLGGPHITYRFEPLKLSSVNGNAQSPSCATVQITDSNTLASSTYCTRAVPVHQKRVFQGSNSVRTQRKREVGNDVDLQLMEAS